MDLNTLAVFQSVQIIIRIYDQIILSLVPDPLTLPNYFF